MANLHIDYTSKQVTIDDEDLERVSKFTWCLSRSKRKLYYVKTNANGGMYLHRFLMDAKQGEIIDHKDRNTLNNKKDNLRRCTTSENTTNSLKHKDGTSGFKGVTFCKQTNKYRAKICKDYHIIDLGRYPTAIEASLAYQRAANKLFGEFKNG